MADMSHFVDVETALMDLLSDLGTTGTYTPNSLVSSLPFIRIMRIGGSDDRFFDLARISIDAFQTTRPLAYALAESIRQRLITGPNVTAPGVLETALTDVGPHEIPWGDTKIRRFTADYTISVRR